MINTNFNSEDILDILEILFDRVWQSCQNFLDQASGTGHFLAAVVSQKIASSFSPYDALETIYDIDFSKENVLKCRRKLLEAAGSPLAAQSIVECRICHIDAANIDLNNLFLK